MNYTKSNKRKLLQGASALILGTMSVAAMAADVTTTTSTIDPSSVDALKVSNQENGDAATANANSNQFSIYSDYETYDSSVAQDGDGASATAQGNNKIDSLTDTAAAEIDTTNAISVDQYNSGTVTANVNETDTWVYSWGADGSTFDVTNNDNLSVAQGNNAATTTSLTGYATNSTETTMAALQNNDGIGLSGGISVAANANNNNTNLELDQFVDGSRGSLSANTDRSAATGNSLTQQMTLGGTTLALNTVSASVTTFALDGVTGATGGTIAVQADGAAILSSSQINMNADTSASTDGSRMNIFSQDIDINGSALDLSSNIQDATATGSAAGNTMTLSGTTVGTGAAIVSSQTNDADSGVTAYTKAEAGIATGNLGNNDASSVSLTDNKIQSRATGGSVSNTMTASATTVTLQRQDQSPSVDIGNGVWPADRTLSGTVSGAFATLNDQLIEGDVSATTTAAGNNGPAFRVYADKNDGSANVIGSTINNDRNTLSAQAQAAVASNSTTLTVGGSLTEAGNTGADTATVANGAAIGNIQQIADSADVSATVDTDTSDGTVSAVLTEVTGNLDGATLVASSNKVQAFAEGATSTNTLAVSARTLDVADGSTANAGSQATSEGYSPTNTAFAVTNVQDSGTGSVNAVLRDSVMIETVIGGTVDGSKVTSAGNMQDAFASSNKSTNTLSLSATTLSGDAGVVNNQISGSDVTAVIGGDNSDGFAAGSTGANAGVIVAVGNDITGSSIAVTGNMVRGSAISNSGTNSLTVAATTLNGDGNNGQALADTGSTTTTADYGLGSYQETQANGSSETQVFATYGIDQTFDSDLLGSSLSVSNNVQFAEALANTVSNRVTLSATGMGEDMAAVAALNNNQYVDSATINSTSDMTVFANAASDGSSITLNGNSNTALGVANNATNVMSVTAVTLGGISSPATVNGGEEYVSADYALLNNQLSDEGGVVNSTALTTIYNQDITDVYTAGSTGSEGRTASAGLLNSSVTMSNNVTTAEASSNRALNSLSVSATDIYATGAVGNLQESYVEVTATASNTSVEMELASRGGTGSDYVASGSTVTMANNATTALARGNSASNTLNYTVGATYNAYSGDAVDNGASVQATAAVMNGQFNEGTVTANANDVRYSIALNDGNAGLAYGPLNSSVSMTGNTVSAVAFGNTANNNLTMSTFGAGIPSSINSNVQFNGGVVQASASGGFMGVYNDQDVQGSAIRNSGNAVSATAIGNNSVSTISGGM